MFFGKHLDALERADIDALVANAVPEGRHLDYKLVLPGAKNSDRKEFIDDVCSLVNAGGGHMLFGIDEETDASGRSTGRPRITTGLHGVNRDHEVLRLDQMILTNIAPRIRHRWEFVDGFPKGPVAVLEIDRSWMGPHITTHSATRFPTRRGAGKYHMDIDEIRAAFASTASTSEQLSAFHSGRISQIAAGQAPVRIEQGALAIVHLLPLQAVSGVGKQIDPRSWAEQLSNLMPLGASGGDHRYNIDGYLTFSAGRPGTQRSYLQTFRNGSLESTSCRYRHEQDGHHWIPSTLFESDLIRFVHQKLVAMVNVGVEMPIAAIASFVRMKGVRLAVDRHGFRQGEPIDRNVLTLPHVLIEGAPADIQEVGRALRPLFDGVWQANGYPCCANYDADGNWGENQIQ